MPSSALGGGRVTAPRNATSASVWWVFGLDCVLATVVRLVLAWRTGGYANDLLTFESWAATLRDHPIGEFYATARSPDHLPGDLWVLKGAELLFTALGGRDVHGPWFALLTQVVPSLGDLLTALMVLLIARRLTSDTTAGTCARWYLLNPATIILTGVWGQWNSVSLGILLTGVWLLLRPDRWWWLSGPFLAWAVLIKPQLTVAVLFLLPIVWRQCELTRSRASPRRAHAGIYAGLGWVASGVLTAYVALAPFHVHLLHASSDGSTLIERVRTAVDLYPFTTMGAANVWMLRIGSLERVRDNNPGWLGLTAQDAGTLMLALALISIGLTCWLLRRRLEVTTGAVWAAAASTLAGFLLSTRVHERYALPVVGLALLLLATQRLDRRLTVWFWVTSVCLTLNQVMVLFRGLQEPGAHRFYFGSVWWVGLSSLYVLLAVTLLTWPWWARPQRMQAPHPLAATPRSRGESHPALPAICGQARRRSVRSANNSGALVRSSFDASQEVE